MLQQPPSSHLRHHDQTARQSPRRVAPRALPAYRAPQPPQISRLSYHPEVARRSPRRLLAPRAALPAHRVTRRRISSRAHPRHPVARLSPRRAAPRGFPASPRRNLEGTSKVLQTFKGTSKVLRNLDDPDPHAQIIVFQSRGDSLSVPFEVVEVFDCFESEPSHDRVGVRQARDYRVVVLRFG